MSARVLRLRNRNICTAGRDSSSFPSSISLPPGLSTNEENRITQPPPPSSSDSGCEEGKSPRSKNAKHGYARETFQVTHVGVRVSRYHCSCGKVYTTRLKLAEHVRSRKAGKIFNCENCDSAFFTHRSLRMHVIKVHGMEYDGKFGCHGCGEVFNTLEEHLRHRKHKGHKVIRLGKAVRGPTPPPSQPQITKFFKRIN